MKQIINTVISQYEDFLIRWYAKIRFTIININILDVLLNYIPHTGRLLTLGCGFGLFECTIALVNPDLEIIGYDLNPTRIEQAILVAKKLNLPNVRFICADVTHEEIQMECNCILTLDLLHHVSYPEQEQLLTRCQKMLDPNGVLIIKDVHRRNVIKLAFTWLLDKMMTQNEPVFYFDQQIMRQRLVTRGFHVIEMAINDWLPYPHIVYIGLKPPRPENSVVSL